jgi:ketosteroid isomerase-like protein
MNYEQASDVAKRWCDAWNNRDIDSVMEHYADDVKFSSPTVIKRLGIESGWLDGKSQLQEHFSVGMQAPNLRFEFVDVLMGVGGMSVVYRRETGVLVVDVIELDEKGKGKVVRAFYGKA